MILGVLLSGGDIARTAKLGGLVQHFKEHQVRSGFSESFLDYLLEHYNPFSKHRSEEHHEQLPGYQGLGETQMPIFNHFFQNIKVESQVTFLKDLPQLITSHNPLKGFIVLDLLLDPPRR